MNRPSIVLAIAKLKVANPEKHWREEIAARDEKSRMISLVHILPANHELAYWCQNKILEHIDYSFMCCIIPLLDTPGCLVEYLIL